VNKNYYQDSRSSCILCRMSNCDHYLYSMDAVTLDLALAANNTTLKKLAHYANFSKRFETVINSGYYYKSYYDRKYSTGYFLVQCSENLKRKIAVNYGEKKYYDNMDFILDILNDFVKDRDESYEITKNYIDQRKIFHKKISLNEDGLYINSLIDIVTLVLMEQKPFEIKIQEYKNAQYFIYNSALQLRDLLFYERKNKPYHIAFKKTFSNFFGGFLFDKTNFINRENAEIIFEAIAYFKGLNRPNTYPQDFKIRVATNQLFGIYQNIIKKKAPLINEEKLKIQDRAISYFLDGFENDDFFVTYNPNKFIN